MSRDKFPNKPSAETLRALYCDQRLNTREIAARLGASPASVKNWLHKHGIPTRPSNRGLVNRGGEPPTADELRQYIHVEHRTYEEVGAIYGVTRGAVMHWLKRHGLRRPSYWETMKKGVVPPPLDEPTLRRLYESGLSAERIGILHGRSQYLVMQLCKSYGIELRPEGWTWGGERRAAQDGHLLRSAYELEVCNWLTDHGVPHVYEPRLPNAVFSADFLANDWYIEVWGVENDPTYNERRGRKEAVYRSHGLPLISIEARHFRKAKAVDRMLRACLGPVCSPLGF